MEGEASYYPPLELQLITANKFQELLTEYLGGRAFGGDSMDGHIIKIALLIILPAVLHVVNLFIKKSRFAHR